VAEAGASAAFQRRQGQRWSSLVRATTVEPPCWRRWPRNGYVHAAGGMCQRPLYPGQATRLAPARAQPRSQYASQYRAALPIRIATAMATTSRFRPPLLERRLIGWSRRSVSEWWYPDAVVKPVEWNSLGRSSLGSVSQSKSRVSWNVERSRFIPKLSTLVTCGCSPRLRGRTARLRTRRDICPPLWLRAACDSWSSLGLLWLQSRDAKGVPLSEPISSFDQLAETDGQYKRGTQGALANVPM
jgi:hypothetical protein